MLHSHGSGRWKTGCYLNGLEKNFKIEGRQQKKILVMVAAGAMLLKCNDFLKKLFGIMWPLKFIIVYCNFRDNRDDNASDIDSNILIIIVQQ